MDVYHLPGLSAHGFLFIKTVNSCIQSTPRLGFRSVFLRSIFQAPRVIPAYVILGQSQERPSGSFTWTSASIGPISLGPETGSGWGFFSLQQFIQLELKLRNYNTLRLKVLSYKAPFRCSLFFPLSRSMWFPQALLPCLGRILEGESSGVEAQV